MPVRHSSSGHNWVTVSGRVFSFLSSLSVCATVHDGLPTDRQGATKNIVLPSPSNQRPVTRLWTNQRLLTYYGYDRRDRFVPEVLCVARRWSPQAKMTDFDEPIADEEKVNMPNISIIL